MTHAAKTAPEADEKMIQRLRDALAFDHRDHELLGSGTTMRLAFAVCNRLGLVPRSAEQAKDIKAAVKNLDDDQDVVILSSVDDFGHGLRGGRYKVQPVHRAFPASMVSEGVVAISQIDGLEPVLVVMPAQEIGP